MNRFRFNRTTCIIILLSAFLLLCLMTGGSKFNKSDDGVSFYDDLNLAAKINNYPKPIPTEASLDTTSFDKIIHITTMMGGYSIVGRLETVIKSLLLFHDGPIHLHILADVKSREVLSFLLETWRLKNVRWSLYDLEGARERLEWVPNASAAGTFGLVKLIMHDILPLYVKKVIVIDTDLLFLRDISQIAAHFQYLNGGVVFATAEDMYNRKKTNRYFPHKDHGENSGVMLLNLDTMRHSDWNDVWMAELQRLVGKFGHLVTSDQDVLTSLALYRPDLHYRLPCNLNFQLGKGSIQPFCLRNHSLSSVVISHWTGARKWGLKWQYTERFTMLYRCVESMDGGIFGEINQEKEMQNRTTHRTTLFMNDFVEEEECKLNGCNVSLVAHSKVSEFIGLLNNIVSTWKGPASLSVWGSDEEKKLLGNLISSTVLNNRTNIAIHFVYKQPSDSIYPEDYLNKVSVNAVKTQRVLLSMGLERFQFDQAFINRTFEKSDLQLIKNSSREVIGIHSSKRILQRILAAKMVKEAEKFALDLQMPFSITGINSEKKQEFNNSSKNIPVNSETPTAAYCNVAFSKRKALVPLSFP